MSFWNQINRNSYWNKENVEGEVNIIKRREEPKGKMRSPHFFPIMSFKGLFGQGTKTIYEGSISSRQSLLWAFHSRRLYWQMPHFDIVCVVCVLGNLKKSLDSPVLSMIRFSPTPNQSINFWKIGLFFFFFSGIYYPTTWTLSGDCLTCLNETLILAWVWTFSFPTSVHHPNPSNHKNSPASSENDRLTLLWSHWPT